MKKLLLFSLCLLVFSITQVYAQSRTVTGTVTAQEDGLPLPGVTVRIKGTTVGTQTSAEGKFIIRVPAAGGKQLQVSYIGYVEQDVNIPAGGIVNVSLVADSKMLHEVVIATAQNVQRSERSLGYAAQAIKGEDLTETKQSDFATALAGKVSGVQVTGGSGAKFGTSGIIIRGISGIGGAADPLYVVDGVPVPSTSINMDDVQDITVLKGSAAVSLYGQRGQNGVVIIVSKKGTKKGYGVEINQSTTIERVSTLPKYQNEYGGSNGGINSWSTFVYNPATDAPGLAGLNGQRYYNYAVDESWGPAFDGKPYIPWYAFNKYDPDYGKTQAYVAQPNNVRDFYKTGVEANQNVAFSSVGDTHNIRMSYTNIERTGVSPNTRADQNRVSLNGMVKPTSKLTFSSQINFNAINYFNRPGEGYGNETIGSLNQWFHRDLEIDKLKNYQNPDGTYTTWNIKGPRNLGAQYWDNPYTVAYANTNRSISNRVFGAFQGSYNIIPEITIDLIARGNYSTGFGDSQVASGTLNQESYSVNQSRDRENNYVFDATYNKAFGEKFTLKAGAYGELRINHSENIAEATAGGFIVPNFYNIAASKDRPTVSNSVSDKKVRSIYGYVSGGYKNMLFVDVNLRNDWSSTLPPSHNSYLYGGVSGSFVFSELIKNKGIFSFGKVFASYARVGSDIDPYNILPTYTANGNYGTVAATLTVPNAIPNANLKPTLSNSIEAGTDLRFLNDRLRLSVNYYYRKATQQIINVTLPSTTGFSSAVINAGQIDNKGIEFTLGGTPIKTRNFSWDINANVGHNNNSVVSLYPGINNFQLASFGYVGTPSITVNREVGKPWGTLITQGIKKDANGNQLIGDDGYPVLEDNQNLGTYVPKVTGGLTTNVTYKNFTLGVSVDFQAGGKIFSITEENLYGSGLAEQTAGLNDKGVPKRNDVADGGGILIPGVRASDGKPNTTYINTQDYYEGYIPYTWAQYVYKSDYVKMREASLTYRLPSAIAKKVSAQNISIGFIARNPWLIYTAIPGIDPSQAGNSWMEGGQLPATRTWGLNLKVTF